MFVGSCKCVFSMRAMLSLLLCEGTSRCGAASCGHGGHACNEYWLGVGSGHCFGSVIVPPSLLACTCVIFLSGMV